MIKYIFNYVKVWLHVDNHHREEEKTFPWYYIISDHKMKFRTTEHYNMKKHLKTTKEVFCTCGYNEVKE